MGGKGSGRKKKQIQPTPEELPGFNWEAAGLVAVICLLIFFGGYVLPNWYHGFEKEHYGKGYAAAKAGEQAVFDDGFEKGRMIQNMIDNEGYKQYFYNRFLYCNDTICRSYTERYDQKYELPWRSPVNFSIWGYR